MGRPKINSVKGTTEERSRTQSVIEDANSLFDIYEGKRAGKTPLPPGNVEYSDGFVNAWHKMVGKKEEDELHEVLLRFLEKMFRRTSECDNDKIREIAPTKKMEFCCSQCGLNHEVRDFIRATFLHLIDDLETNPQFIKFLYDNEFVTQEAYEHIQKRRFINEVKDNSSKQQNIPATLQSTSSPAVKKYIIENNDIDQLIKMFAESGSFKEVRKRCKEVLNFTEQINKKQVNDMMYV
jgi:hypothetical protein